MFLRSTKVLKQNKQNRCGFSGFGESAAESQRMEQPNILRYRQICDQNGQSAYSILKTLTLIGPFWTQIWWNVDVRLLYSHFKFPTRISTRCLWTTFFCGKFDSKISPSRPDYYRYTVFTRIIFVVHFILPLYTALKYLMLEILKKICYYLWTICEPPVIRIV